MFNNSVYLTESDLKQVIRESARRILEEGFLKDKLQSRREEQEKRNREMAYLKSKLESEGIDELTPAKSGDRYGFTFRIPLSQAHQAARNLKDDGVAITSKTQDGGGDWDREIEMFAWLKPYVTVR